MPVREQRIQRSIIVHLRSMGAWVFNVHGSPYQQAGVPDLLVGYKGRLYAMEVKRPGQPLSPIQAKVIEEIRASGCIAGRVESIEEAEEMLNECTYQG
jgi:Holliday junction resolvase